MIGRGVGKVFIKYDPHGKSQTWAVKNEGRTVVTRYKNLSRLRISPRESRRAGFISLASRRNDPDIESCFRFLKNKGALRTRQSSKLWRRGWKVNAGRDFQTTIQNASHPASCSRLVPIIPIFPPAQ